MVKGSIATATNLGMAMAGKFGSVGPTLSWMMVTRHNVATDGDGKMQVH